MNFADQYDAQKPVARSAMATALDRLRPHLPVQTEGRPPHRVEVISWDPPDMLGHQTWDEAIAEWERRFMDYIRHHPGDLLVWNVPPDIDALGHAGQESLLWRVYSLFAIQ